MNNWDDIKKLYNIIDHKNKFGYHIDEIINVETQLQIKIPKTLKSYYLSLAKNRDINHSHHRLLQPNKGIRFSNDGYLIIYEENQASVFWGIKEEDLIFKNPSVWGNYGTTELPNWQVETKTIRDFLLLMAIYNGTLGGLMYNANYFGSINTDIVNKISKNWKEIKNISWHKQKNYTNNFEEVINLSFDNQSNCTAIFIGTSDKERFENLLKKIDVNWSYISYENEDY